MLHHHSSKTLLQFLILTLGKFAWRVAKYNWLLSQTSALGWIQSKAKAKCNTVVAGLRVCLSESPRTCCLRMVLTSLKSSTDGDHTVLWGDTEVDDANFEHFGQQIEQQKANACMWTVDPCYGYMTLKKTRLKEGNIPPSYKEATVHGPAPYARLKATDQRHGRRRQCYNQSLHAESKKKKTRNSKQFAEAEQISYQNKTTQSGKHMKTKHEIIVGVSVLHVYVWKVHVHASFADVSVDN
ncbi:hypothetical protein V6N12_044625 [Hibiscus sabdariffa]|uniref:Uncharacterized protein n=1 Tax=Hibiscus sabdariffa TaxID=183260 RepID=A0ABR2AY06_9ROSI